MNTLDQCPECRREITDNYENGCETPSGQRCCREHVRSVERGLEENVRAARLALAEHLLWLAELDHAESVRTCACNPDTHTYDPYCRVADTIQYVDRAKAEVTRFQPLTG